MLTLRWDRRERSGRPGTGAAKSRRPNRPHRPTRARLAVFLALVVLATCDWIAGLGNDAPLATTAIRDRIVAVDDTVGLDLGLHFSDPDGDSLTYSAVSAAPATVAATARGGMLWLTGVAAGRAAVTVTARDPEGLTAVQSFEVTVPNRAPEPLAAIPDGEVYVDSTLVIDAADHFADPDGDDLEYSATSSDPTRAAVTVSGSVVSLTGMAVGSTTVTVTVRDPGGLEAAQSFVVTVPNRAPVAVGTIADREVRVDSVAALDLAPYFTDPDREPLAYAVASSDPARALATVAGTALTLTGVAKGVATVTVTARDPHGLAAEQRFVVTVPNRGPVAAGAIADREVFVGDWVAIEVAGHFTDPDGDALEYAAVSSDTGRVAVAVRGGVVTVTGVSVGSAMVTVTARDPEGLSAEQVFGVTMPNRAPEALGAIADREVQVDSMAALDIADRFTDPDGQELEYAAASSDPSRALAAIAGSALTVTGVARGVATVTVTARDPHGLEAGQSFEVTVPNRGPVAAGEIADREVFVGDGVEIEVGGHFADPDGDALQYAAASSDAARVVVAVAGAVVTVTGVSVGSAVVTVTARDPEGLSAEQVFGVTVPNRAPESLGAIADREVEVDSMAALDIADRFTDPDGQELEYAAASSDPSRVVAAIAGSMLTLTGVARGRATVTVTARDPHGLEARQRFQVTVPNRGPVAVGAIADREVFVGDGVEIDVAGHFTDPDGDALGYAAVSSDTGRVTAVVRGGVVTVTGVSVGSARVTVTARDAGGLSAEQVFRVTMPNRPPRLLGAIADREVEVESVAELDLAAHFTDPDGEELEYAAASSDTDRVVAAIAGSTLTVTGVTRGVATVTVTARDPHGLQAEQRFAVTVPNQAPVALGEIAPRVVQAGSSVAVDVEDNFTDPDDDALDFSATSSHPSRATVSVSGAVVTVTAVAGGVAVVTVAAHDPAGLFAQQRFIVTVPNRSPEAVGKIGDRTVKVEESFAVDVSLYFGDPDGDELTHTAASSNTALVTVGVSGSSVTVTGEGAGTATVTVTATDPGGLSATQQFGIIVDPAQPSDLVVRSPAARPGKLVPGGTFALSAVVHNRRAGSASSGTTLRYYLSADATIGRDDTEVGTDPVPLLGPSESSAESLLVTAPTAHGTYHYGACVDSVANESSTTNNCSVAVEVVVAPPNRAPTVVNNLPDLLNINPGWRYAAHLPEVFADPDGDPLDWTTSSSNVAAVESEIANDSIIVTALAAGSATLTVTATDPGGLSATDEFEVSVAGARFDMEVLFTDDVEESHRERMRKGRDTWESALAPTELADVVFNGRALCFGMVADLTTVDDHVAYVHVDSIDGPGKIAAQATYCHIRNTDGTPIVSGVRFDEADIGTLFARGRLLDIAMHEFAHGLGFHHSYWRSLNKLDEGADPHFKGPRAIAAFNAAGGTTYTGEKVPVTSPVTGHWRESVFGTELMSPRYSLNVSNPLSAITIQAMADVGYVVDASVADDFDLPNTAPPDLAADAPPWDVDLRDDVVQGPVIVVDSDGRIVRVDPAPPGAPPPPVQLRTVPVGPQQDDAPGIWVRSPPRRDPPLR